MVKKIKLKKVTTPSGCSIDTSGNFIIDNEPEYEIHSDDECVDEDSGDNKSYDYSSSASPSDTEDCVPAHKPPFTPSSFNVKQYKDELQEETDFKIPEKNIKR
jgi:hypothetical protein